MKRIIALLLCLCFALGGCAQSGTESHTENDGSAKPDPSTGSTPVASESFERLALGLAALPELPEEPDETALWEKMNGLSTEDQGKLWEEFDAQQRAYYDAISALRGDGVDAALSGAFAAYTLRTARQLMEHETEKNVVWSPANLYLALCMLCETTDGASRAQLLGLLGLENVEQARSAANTLWRSLYNDSATGKTLLANSIWLNDQFDFHPDTVNTLAKEYFASAFRAPMGDTKTDAAIAQWVNENTNHLLENAAGALKTKPETLLMLISTLYFKGTWSDQFDQYNTREDTFTAAGGAEQKVDFMHKTQKGTYYRGDRFTVASLPFRDGTTMWFLLPDEGVSVQDAVLTGGTPFNGFDVSPDATLETAFGSAVASQGYADIAWSVPKFDVDADLDLIPALNALGITDIFGSDADFSPLTDLDAQVSAMEHAARVKVDEEGCEAAAFTAITMETTSALVEPLPVVEMNLNRPFGFLITGADGLPLFLSIVNTME